MSADPTCPQPTGYTYIYIYMYTYMERWIDKDIDIDRNIHTCISVDPIRPQPRELSFSSSSPASSPSNNKVNQHNKPIIAKQQQ